MILFGLSLNLKAQEGSFEQYYYMGPNTTFNMIPVFTQQLSGKRFVEFRYNYEDLKTASVFVGQTFDGEANLSYSLSPKAGFMVGGMNGGVVGLDVELSYKKFSLSSQPQYAFSLKNTRSNFIYSWTDIICGINGQLNAGISLQSTKLYNSPLTLERGLMIEPSFKKWSFPIYVFNPETGERYFVIGINFEW